MNNLIVEERAPNPGTGRRLGGWVFGALCGWGFFPRGLDNSFVVRGGKGYEIGEIDWGKKNGR